MYHCNTLITTDKEFASREKRISICLGANGFSFTETTTGNLLLTFGIVEGTHGSTMTDVMADIKALFASLHINPLGYASSELIVLSDENVWVPDELYTLTAVRQYFHLTGAEPLSIMNCHSAPLASTMLFSANEHVTTAFKVIMPGLKVMNQHLKMSQLDRQKHPKPLLLTHWREGRVDVAAFSAERYLYGNTLSFANTDEAVFRIVDVMKSHQLETPDTEVLLCGNVDRDIYAAARPYFPKVSLFSGTPMQFLNPQFEQLHTYRHALLLM